jgi:alkylation response protein AidB-like acyl-CoA dehydrogenase
LGQMSVIPHPAGLLDTQPACPSGEERAWQSRALEFAEEVVRPLGMVLDRMPAAEAFARSSPIHELIALANRERFTRLTDSVALGGAAISREAEYLVLEELAAADAGLTALIVAAPLPFRWSQVLGDAALRERLALPFLAGARPEQSGCVVHDANGRLRAWRDGGGWRLRGAVSEPVTAAASATHAAVGCLTAATPASLALAIVPLDRRGVHRMSVPPGPGLRTRSRAAITFADVRIEPDELLTGPLGAATAASLPALDQLAVAIGCVGIARSACEGAARVSVERGIDATREIDWMRARVDGARSLVRAMHGEALANLDAGAQVRLRQAAAVNALAVETATKLARTAITLCGAAAFSREGIRHLDRTRFHAGKLLRDANAARASAQHLRPGTQIVAVHRQSEGSTAWVT